MEMQNMKKILVTYAKALRTVAAVNARLHVSQHARQAVVLLTRNAKKKINRTSQNPRLPSLQKAAFL